MNGVTVVGVLVLLSEISVLFVLGIKIWRVRGRLRTAEGSLIDRLEGALAAELRSRRLAAVLATEAAAVAYAVGCWRKPTPTDGFSTHRERSYLVLVGVFSFLVVVETAGLHIAIGFLSTTAAWVMTALSLYGLLWIIGDTQAVRLSPVRLAPDGLSVARGIRWRAEVPYAIIDLVEPVEAAPKTALRFGPIGTNVLLTLREPVVARGVFGRRRETREIALMIDGREAFLADLSRRVGTPRPALQPSPAA